jgi:predicted enzyme related to lactoylglutathione lyase
MFGNLDQAISFYTQTLGLTLVNPDLKAECGVELKAGPLTLWIDGTSAKQEEEIGKVFFEFTVENLSESVKFLESEGCKSGIKTSGPSFVGRMLIDPFGMRFHLYHLLRKPKECYA